MIRRPLSLLIVALAGLLAFGAFVAFQETVPAERGIELARVACAPAEPPVSRLGCAP